MKGDSTFETCPLPDATFGARVRLGEGADVLDTVAAAEAAPDRLPRLLYAADGLLLMPGLERIADDPSLLVRLSALFGPEVEDYRQTLMDRRRVHAEVPEIMIVSNLPPAGREPPPRPDPPTTPDGGLPVRFPHRRGWHTDQSYRRPPPDISLLYAVSAVPKGQGQTLFANGRAAYDALPAKLKARIEDLQGLHVMPGKGRSEYAVRAGQTPDTLLPHQRPQRQPVVRIHPVTGKPALYLCEAGQMDWVEGPFVGMEPGPDGDGAKLLYELMAHYTRPEFTYVHAWERGDLVIFDNRAMVHAATWFDSGKYGRVLWRTTVRGNPGAEYAGEERSWLPADGRAAAPAGG